MDAIKHYLQRRRTRKLALHVLREARHVRHMREDMAAPEELRKLTESETALARAVKQGDLASVEPLADRVFTAARKLSPLKPMASLRENFEILVVAFAVAMAFRTFFIQPFKIPTHSMKPTLYGIHYEPADKPGLGDRYPVKLLKWLIFGEWYVAIHAETSGHVQMHTFPGKIFPSDTTIRVGNADHRVYDGMTAHVHPGDYVFKGQLLASGIRNAGDHIFVNRVSWNFRKPQRGEIMVFRTMGILHPDIKTNEYYVKRMVGLPGETVSIAPPNLKINGDVMSEPEAIARIERKTDGYAGYLTTERFNTLLRTSSDTVSLKDDEYFACGDNQPNSADSRYWGPVPQKNLVGPAFMVYWPFSSRWGFRD
ncbi:MAG: signal peptidase I [Lentisphaerae bacterium]|nr:signal peptidase I [Lentisphaerota bacterium]